MVCFTKNIQPKRIKCIKTYIADHYTEPISLQQVADLACYSPEAFCRYFKKHMGVTFITYLNRFRVDKACELLLNNTDEQSIANIAYTVGFTSISSFNRMFLRRVGVSPIKYISREISPR